MEVLFRGATRASSLGRRFAAAPHFAICDTLRLATGVTFAILQSCRTGSVVVERKGSPSAPGDIVDNAGVVKLRQQSRGSGCYAEEERFWAERCPTDSAPVAASRGDPTDGPVITPRHAVTVGSRPEIQRAGREASYDYSTAEAAYRPCARKPATHCVGSSSHDDDRAAGKGPRSRRRRTRKARFEEEEGDSSNGTGDTSPHELRKALPKADASSRGVRANSVERIKGEAQRRRTRSLQDAESVLHGVLESMAGAAPTEDVSASEDDGVLARKTAEVSSK